MIPQRRPSRDGYGNGVSCRVEACRKRLRVIRGNHVAALQHDHGDDVVAELAMGGASVSAPGKLSFVTNLAEGQDEAGLT